MHTQEYTPCSDNDDFEFGAVRDISIEAPQEKPQRCSYGKAKCMNLFRHMFKRQFYLRLIFSLLCCVLYIVQTVMPNDVLTYPSYCCGVMQYSSYPCVLDGYENGTIGSALRENGCVYADKLLEIDLNSFVNSSERKFIDPLNAGVCKPYCQNGFNCSGYILEKCICAIECGNVVYCGLALQTACIPESFNYWKLLFFEKPIWLYIFQVITSLLVMLATLIRVIFLFKRGVRFFTLIDESLIFDWMNGILSLITLAYAPCLKDLYIPYFLQIFTVRLIIHNILFGFDITGSSKFITPIIQSITDALLLLVSVLFASICSVHYLERVACSESDPHITTLFDSFWFIIVTITTVGYGDLSPVTPLGQLSVIALILVILLFLPKTLGDILQLITDSKQNYKFYHCRDRDKHVVLCVSKLDMIMINDYLDEFYALEDNVSLVTVVFTAQPPTPLVKIRLEGPALEKKVIVIVGSALVLRDLERVNVALAKACIILSDRLVEDAQMSDQETILRASSIHKFAPHVKLYIRLFRPENRMNLKFADQVVCEGQFKQVLMANNCIYPGFSSFLTLLLHTTNEEDSDNMNWEDLYRYCSGNEIYDIRLGDSLLFASLVNRTFLFASIVIQFTTYVLLFAVKPANASRILLNPGRHHILKEDDILYYIAPGPEKVIYADRKITQSDLGRFLRIFQTHSREAMTMSMVSITSKDIERLDEKDMNMPTDHVKESSFLAPSCEMSDSSRKYPAAMNAEKHQENIVRQLSSHSDPIVLAQNKRRELFRRSSSRALVHEQNFAGTPLNSFNRQLSDLLDDSKQTKDLKSLDNLSLEDNTDFRKRINLQESVTTYISVNPCPIYIGVKETVHHLNKVATPLCCLEAGWKVHCHKIFEEKEKKYYRGQHVLHHTGFTSPLIVCADEAGSQLYEFLLPLRAYHIPTENLIPIVIILPNTPDVAFLEAISWIPYIRYIVGNHECVDDLLIAGALDAVGIIICLGDGMPELKEERHMVDAGRLSTAQKLSQIFVNTKLYVELAHRWSMKYLMLHAGYTFQTVTPKSVKYFMHTPYFMSGQAFAPSMMDTLLYQCTQKEYIVELMELLLGLQQTPGSGYICKYEVTEFDIETYVTYGHMILALAIMNNYLSLAIYRTRMQEIENRQELESQYSETASFLSKRAYHLGITDPIPNISPIVQNSHILVNPPADTPLLLDDVFLVIKVCSSEQYEIIHSNQAMKRESIWSTSSAAESMYKTSFSFSEPTSQFNPRPKLLRIVPEERESIEQY